MWARTWGIALALFVLALGAIEAGWRAAGHLPSVVDDAALWSQQLDRVDSDPGTVVLVGMSRMQLGFSSEVFRQRYPDRKLVRLEAPLRHPISALGILARDPDFRGTVIASITMSSLRAHQLPGLVLEHSFYLERFGPTVRIDRRVASFVQSHLAAVNPYLDLRDVLITRLEGRSWPPPHFITTLPDRSRLGRYSLNANLPAYALSIASTTGKRHQRNHQTPEQLIEQQGRVQRLADRIARRGGRVVLIRFPTSGLVWQQDEAWYPKARYWDPFVSRLSIPALHARDVPSLADFVCADGSHLDASERDAFTARLLDELERRGLLGVRPGEESPGRRSALLSASRAAAASRCSTGGAALLGAAG
jgi:hypothetical protein